MSGRFKLSAVCLVLVCSVAAEAHAQGLRNVVRGAAKRAADREVERQVEQKVRKVVRCAFGDEACAAKARREGNQVEVVGNGGSGTSAAPAQDVSVNYDFVPGDRVLFAEDFTGERVGNFPRSLKFISGNMEIADIGGKRYLRSTDYGSFVITLPETLPERFTMEMEYRGQVSRGLEILTEEFRRNPTYYPNSYAVIDDSKAGLTGGRSTVKDPAPQALVRRGWKKEEIVPVRLMADGDYLKMYVGDQRVANVPNARVPRGRVIQLNLRGHESYPSFLGNIRIAAGNTSIYDALVEEGRVATQGIYFDTGSDVIRPESTPTLTEIGQMLQQHADLRLRIEGHTDSTGSSAANRALSEKRAAAVRDHLVRNYGITGSRLEAQGHGDARPTASNDTPEGRQQNRRVELVRL